MYNISCHEGGGCYLIMLPLSRIMCVLAAAVMVFSGCSSVQINSNYGKSPLPKTLNLAPASFMIFQLDTVPGTFNTPSEKLDREEELKLKSNLAGFIDGAGTRFSFMHPTRKATDDEYRQILFDIMSGIMKSGVEGYTVPGMYRKYFMNRNARFTVVICHTGFYRTERNLTSMAKAAAVTGLASLGTVMLVYKTAFTDFQYCVIDTDTMKVVLYNRQTMEDDPRTDKVMKKHLDMLLGDLGRLGT
jgi:hypothetical protein